MPRKVRLQYPGAMYHVMSRGDQREDIFLDEVDRHDFIRMLAVGARLRRETTLSVKRIAERLHLGKPAGARANLHRWLKQPAAGNLQIQLGI